MQNILLLILIDLIYSINFHIPSEDVFHPIASNTKTLINLTAIENELYYRFDLESDMYVNGQIVFQFTRGDGDQHKVYIYTEFAHIEKDKEGDYVGSAYSFDLNKKEISFENNQKFVTFYLIFKANKDYSYCDNFKIFNEKEFIPLKFNEVFTVNRFYSNREYKFYLESQTQVLLEVITIHKRMLPSTTISIKAENGEKTIITSRDAKSSLEPGKHTVIVAISNDSTLENPKQIMFSSISNKLHQLEPKKIMDYNIISSKELFFYSVIDQYEYLEENTITVNITSSAQKQLLAYAQVIQNPTPPTSQDIETQLKKLFPLKTLSAECHFSMIKSLDTLHQLFFSNPIKERQKGSYLYLLFTLKIDFVNAYSPLLLSFVLSDRMVISQFPSFQIFDIKTEQSIPLYFKFYFDPKSDKNPLLFFSNSEATVFQGNLTSKEILSKEPFIRTQLNNDYLTGNLIPFNNLFRKLRFITVWFCCKQEATSMIVQSFEGTFQYEKKPFNQGVYQHQDIACSKPFHLIGAFNSAYTYSIYFETLYGKFSLYNNRISIEKARENEALITNKTSFGLVNIEENLSSHIISIKCISPGFVNIYFFNQTTTIHLEANKKATVLVLKNTPTLLTFPETKEMLNLVIETPFDYPVKINDTELLKGKLFEVNYSHSYEDISLTASEADTYVIVNLVKKHLFKNTKSKDIMNSDQFIFFELKQENYIDFQIKIENSTSVFYYSFIYGNTEIIPITFSNWSRVKYQTKDWKSPIYTNPYNKYNSLQASEPYCYHLVVHFDNPVKDISIIATYNRKEPEIKIIDVKPNTLAKLFFEKSIFLNFTTPSKKEEQSLFVFFSICERQPFELDLYHDSLIISSHLGINTTGVFKIHNYLINAFFNLFLLTEKQFRTIYLSYNYSDTSIDYFDTINALNTSLIFEGNELKWLTEEETKYFKEYHVYQVPYIEGIVPEFSLMDICSLDQLTYSLVTNNSFTISHSGR